MFTFFIGPMPISVDRERRANAGARMARLLNEEEEDEFYSNIYGGFAEVLFVFYYLSNIYFLCFFRLSALLNHHS